MVHIKCDYMLLCNFNFRSWIDIWDVLSKECREEVVLVECDSLMDTLENYLRKHRCVSWNVYLKSWKLARTFKHVEQGEDIRSEEEWIRVWSNSNMGTLFMFNRLYLANQITFIYVLYIFQYVLVSTSLCMSQFVEIKFWGEKSKITAQLTQGTGKGH